MKDKNIPLRYRIKDTNWNIIFNYTPVNDLRLQFYQLLIFKKKKVSKFEINII